VGCQERRRHPLAGDVAEREQQAVAVAGLHQVAVVAAHRAGRLGVDPDLPVAGHEVAGGQERALDPAGQLEVAFEVTPLVVGQVVEAVARQRVGDQSLGLDRFVARVAQAEATVVEAGERRVDLGEQALEVGKSPGMRQLGGELSALLLEVRTDKRSVEFDHLALPPGEFTPV